MSALLLIPDVFGSNDQVSEQLSSPRPLVSSSSNPPIIPGIPLPLPLTISTLGTVQTESSLKKLSKDLHRCDVSLSRYQNSLNEVSQPQIIANLHYVHDLWSLLILILIFNPENV